MKSEEIKLKTITFADVVKEKYDAGLYRQYIAQNHGSIFIFGGSFPLYELALFHCKRLAKLTGNTLEDMIENAKNDYDYDVFGNPTLTVGMTDVSSNIPSGCLSLGSSGDKVGEIQRRLGFTEN